MMRVLEFYYSLPPIVKLIPFLYIFLLSCFYFLSDSVIFQPPRSSYRDNENIIKIPVTNQISISGVYLSNKNAKYTIVLSHGNAEDIGTALPFLQMLRDQGYSVFAYDYQGYGTSQGRASVANTYLDIRAVYDYLTNHLKIPPLQIILLGRSVGTGPSTYLATKVPVRALILQSPFVSAYRVMTRIPIFPFDKYPNLKNIKKIKVPVLVISGTNDRVIPFWHSKMIYDAANEPKQHYWVEGADHNDLYLIAQQKFFDSVKAFTNSLD